MVSGGRTVSGGGVILKHIYGPLREGFKKEKRKKKVGF